MRGFLAIVFVLVIVLMAYPFIFVDEQHRKELTGLPWQIEQLADGYTEVFGLTPGRSTLADAVAQLGRDYEFGIISTEQDRDLEMYYSSYRAGLMSAKIVLGTEVDDDLLEAWLSRSHGFEYLKTGNAKQHFVAEQDVDTAMATVIRVITFIPAVNLDDEIIRQRFGEPSDVIEDKNGAVHYLYADKGLDIVLSEEGKEVLQYVAPTEFDSLRVTAE